MRVSRSSTASDITPYSDGVAHGAALGSAALEPAVRSKARVNRWRGTPLMNALRIVQERVVGKGRVNEDPDEELL